MTYALAVKYNWDFLFVPWAHALFWILLVCSTEGYWRTCGGIHVKWKPFFTNQDNHNEVQYFKWTILRTSWHHLRKRLLQQAEKEDSIRRCVSLCVWRLPTQKIPYSTVRGDWQKPLLLWIKLWLCGFRLCWCVEACCESPSATYQLIVHWLLPLMVLWYSEVKPNL